MLRALAILAVLVLFLLALLPVVYLGWRWEEDKRGPRAWDATLAELRQHGEPTDYAAIIPPRIPDATNLGALPLFQVERDPGTRTSGPVRLKAALENINDGESEALRNGWTKGRSTDAAALDRFLADRFHKVFTGRSLPPSPLDQFDALCPAIVELREAAATRPGCRFDRDYTTMPPFARLTGSTTELILLAKVINLHAITALQVQNTPVALRDIELDLQLDAGLRQEPQLISGLVAAGVVAIQLDAIWEGLEAHAWNDAQLAELQHRLAGIDFLADDQLCLRGEALGFFAPMMDYLKLHQLATRSIVANLSTASDANHNAALETLWMLTPPGSYDMTKAEGVALDFAAARDPVDSPARRVYSERLDMVETKAKHAGGYSITGILEHVSAPPILNALVSFSEAQFRVDAARVACMIERYRLAHGALPATLDQLAPYADDGAGLPRDLCNGQPLHYTARSDGTYLLYSVGWNQLDDGGQVVYKADEPKAVDPRRGDWVWPQPGHPGT